MKVRTFSSGYYSPLLFLVMTAVPVVLLCLLLLAGGIDATERPNDDLIEHRSSMNSNGTAISIDPELISSSISQWFNSYSIPQTDQQQQQAAKLQLNRQKRQDDEEEDEDGGGENEEDNNEDEDEDGGGEEDEDNNENEYEDGGGEDDEDNNEDEDEDGRGEGDNDNDEDEDDENEDNEDEDENDESEDDDDDSDSESDSSSCEGLVGCLTKAAHSANDIFSKGSDLIDTVSDAISDPIGTVTSLVTGRNGGGGSGGNDFADFATDAISNIFSGGGGGGGSFDIENPISGIASAASSFFDSSDVSETVSSLFNTGSEVADTFSGVFQEGSQVVSTVTDAVATGGEILKDGIGLVGDLGDGLLDAVDPVKEVVDVAKGAVDLGKGIVHLGQSIVDGIGSIFSGVSSEMKQDVSDIKNVVTKNAEVLQENSRKLAGIQVAVAQNGQMLAENHKDIERNGAMIAQNHQDIERNGAMIGQNYEALQNNSRLIRENAQAIQAAREGIAQNQAAIGENGAKIDKNFQAIQAMEQVMVGNQHAVMDQFWQVRQALGTVLAQLSKTRQVIMNRLETLEQHLTDKIVSEGMKQRLSDLNTALKWAIDRMIEVRRASAKKLNDGSDSDDSSGLTDPMSDQEAKLTQIFTEIRKQNHPGSGGLYSSIWAVVNTGDAIPSQDGNEDLSLSALHQLVTGVQVYLALVTFEVEQYSVLLQSKLSAQDPVAYNVAYQQAVLDVQSLLAVLVKLDDDDDASDQSSDGLKALQSSSTDTLDQNPLPDNYQPLIDAVLDQLQNVSSLGFIKRQQPDFIRFTSTTIRSLRQVRGSMKQLARGYTASVPTWDQLELDFSTSTVALPHQGWTKDGTVTYAFQFVPDHQWIGTSVTDWYSPGYQLEGKGNPVVTVPTAKAGHKGENSTRAVYRKLNDGKPTMVAWLTDPKQMTFRDVSYELYQGAAQPNLDAAPKEVRFYLGEKGVDPNLAPWAGNQRALHLAVKRGQMAVVRELLGANTNTTTNVDVNVQDAAGNTPLMLAVKAGNLAMVQQLLKAPNMNVSLKTAPEAGGLSPLHQLAFHPVNDNQASYSNTTLAMAKLILSHPSVDPNSASHPGGKTPLHIASSACHMDMVDLLLGHKSIQLDLPTTTGQNLTALHLAAINNCVPALKRLSSLGANPNSTHNPRKRAPIHLAAQFLSEAAASELVDTLQVDTSGRDYLGHTVLHRAAFGGSHQLVSKVATSSNVNLKSYAEQPPLYLSVHYNWPNVTQALMAAGANPLLRLSRNRTILHMAVEEGDTVTVSQMFDHLGDQSPLMELDSQGRTALHTAVVQSQLMIPYLILKQAASNNQTQTLFGVQDSAGQTVVELTVGLTPEKRALDMLKVLVDNGADLKQVYPSFGTLLHGFAARGYSSVVKYLLAQVMDPAWKALTRKSDGLTAFELAVAAGDLASAQALMPSKLSDLVSDDMAQYNLLLAAAKAKSQSSAELLKLLSGAGLELAPQALTVALIAGNDQAAQWLLGNMNLTDDQWTTPQGEIFTDDLVNRFDTMSPYLAACFKGSLTVLKDLIEGANKLSTPELIQQQASLIKQFNFPVLGRGGNDTITQSITYYSLTSGQYGCLGFALLGHQPMPVLDYLLNSQALVGSNRSWSQAYYNQNAMRIDANVELQLAIEAGRQEMVDYYLGQQKDNNTTDQLSAITFIPSPTQNYQTPSCMSGSPIGMAIVQGDLKLTQRLIDLTKEQLGDNTTLLARVLNEPNCLRGLQPNSLLCLALGYSGKFGGSENKTLKLIDMLVGTGLMTPPPDYFSATCLPRVMSPLLLATEQGMSRVVRQLLKHNLTTDGLKAVSNEGWTGLHFAAAVNKLDLVKLFVEQGGLAVDALTNTTDPKTPLRVALEAGTPSYELVKYLTDKGADFSSVLGPQPDPVKTLELIDKALTAKNTPLAMWVLQQSRPHLASDRPPCSELHVAFRAQHIPLIRSLLMNGSNSTNLTAEQQLYTVDARGQTPLELMRTEGLDLVTTYMVEYFREKSTSDQGQDGRSLFRIASDRGDTLTTDYLMERGADSWGA